LSPDAQGDPIDFGSTGEPTRIRVIPFYYAVKKYWDGLDKATLIPRVDKNSPPKNPAPTNNSPAQASGYGDYTVTSTRSFRPSIEAPIHCDAAQDQRRSIA